MSPEQANPYRGFGKHGLQVWRDAKGRALIEVHSIAGMGHGTPIDARAVEGGSTAAPFMLDVGISSTLEIARSWGLAPVADVGAMKTRPASRSETLVNGTPTPKPANPSSKGIGKVIEDALRAAGLMK